jgi:hypothetical protein
MRPSALMAGLYPPAVRERWGAEISRQVSESGIRSWPDTLLGAARLWLHPSDWPETSDGQTRQVLAVALFAVTAVTALLARAAHQPVVLTASLGHPVTSLWLAPILLGAGLAVPAPPLRWRALRELATAAARTLVGPAIAVAVMIVTARADVLHHPVGHARIGLIAGYWTVLSFTALRLCTLIARYARTAHLPTTRRLRAAAMLIGTGLSLAAGQSLIPLTRTAPGTGSLTLALALSLLAAATITAAHDLRQP